MANTFFVFLAVSCLPTLVVNVSGDKWNAYDNKMLDHAKVRCGELDKDFPCVRLFRKFGVQSYTVICGVKKNVRSVF